MCNCPQETARLALFASLSDSTCKPHFSQLINNGTTPGTDGDETGVKPTFDAESIVGLVIFVVCVLYSSIRTTSSGQTERLMGTDKVLAKDDGAGSPIRARFSLTHFNFKLML